MEQDIKQEIVSIQLNSESTIRCMFSFIAISNG